MTDEEWKKLSELTKKAQIDGRMGLNDDELRILREARRELKFHERMRLLGLSRTATGTVWLDFGEISESMIQIDDGSSTEREERPFAYIWLTQGYERCVETVDIIESVKQNPMSIGHPAILFAIHRWQEVIQAQRLIARDDVDSARDETMRAFKRAFDGGLELESAKRNLDKLMKAFKDGVRDRRITNEVAFAIKAKSMGLLGSKDNLLYKAWQRLAPKYVKDFDSPDDRRKRIKDFLLEAERAQPNLATNLSIRKVMNFLEEDGARFVYDEKSVASRRPQWKVFWHAFLAWNFQMKPTSIQEYLERANKEDFPDKSFQPSLTAPKAQLANLCRYIWALPLTTTRDSLLVHEDDVGFNGLAAALEASEKRADGPN